MSVIPFTRKMCAPFQAPRPGHLLSAFVLYMAKEARHVEVTPKRSSNGWRNGCRRARQRPERSITIETSWAWRPWSSKETNGALAWRGAEDAQRIDARQALLA